MFVRVLFFWVVQRENNISLPLSLFLRVGSPMLAPHALLSPRRAKPRIALVGNLPSSSFRPIDTYCLSQTRVPHTTFGIGKFETNSDMSDFSGNPATSHIRV